MWSNLVCQFDFFEKTIDWTFTVNNMCLQIFRKLNTRSENSIKSNGCFLLKRYDLFK